MDHKDKIAAIKVAIIAIVKSSTSMTVKGLMEILGISKSHLNKLIVDIGNIHRIDSVLYVGERL